MSNSSEQRSALQRAVRDAARCAARLARGHLGCHGAGYFWPMWPALALGIAIGIWFALRWARTQRQKATRLYARYAGVLGRARGVVDRDLGDVGRRVLLADFPLLVGFSCCSSCTACCCRRASARLSYASTSSPRTRSGALDVQSSELRRIERDLHDGAQARLVALSMQLGRAEERLADQPETAALVRSAREEATAAIAELRDLARGIAPPVLADRGLVAAAQSLANRSSATSRSRER